MRRALPFGLLLLVAWSDPPLPPGVMQPTTIVKGSTLLLASPAPAPTVTPKFIVPTPTRTNTISGIYNAGDGWIFVSANVGTNVTATIQYSDDSGLTWTNRADATRESDAYSNVIFAENGTNAPGVRVFRITVE